MTKRAVAVLSMPVAVWLSVGDISPADAQSAVTPYYAASPSAPGNTQVVTPSTPLPIISAPISTSSTTTAETIGTTGAQLVAAGTSMKGWVFANTMTAGSYRIWICYSVAASCTPSTAITYAFPGSSITQADAGNALPPAGTPISAVADAAGQTGNFTVQQ